MSVDPVPVIIAEIFASNTGGSGALDFGSGYHAPLPQDVAELERRLHDNVDSADRLFGCPVTAIDEVHWLAFGPEGKALQVRKWLHDKSITEHTEAANLTPFVESAPLAPQQQYTVRRMQPSEAVQVSQLMYRTYGGTYFNPDVYYPERVAAHNANGSVISNRGVSAVACAKTSSAVSGRL